MLFALLDPPKKDKQYNMKAYAAAYMDTNVNVPNILAKTIGQSGDSLLAYQPIIKATGIKAATSDHKKK